MAQQPLVGLGPLIIEASPHSDTPHLVGLLWMSYQLDNTHKKQISMPPAGFEPTIAASKQPQTHALDSAATSLGLSYIAGENILLRRQRYCRYSNIQSKKLCGI
jgi:hypothetical protein